MNPRKIVVSVAASADGYIARLDGSYDWLDRPRRRDDPAMAEFGRFLQGIDTVLWGRKTYDLARKAGAALSFGQGVKNYVFTHQPPPTPVPDAEFVNEPVEPFAQQLRAAPGKDIWIMGGGGIIASFLDAGEIDEFIVAVVPVFIGEGIPLIQPSSRTVKLELLSSRQFPDGIVRLHYGIPR